MKIASIIGIVIIAVCIGVMMTTLSSTTTYGNFTEASENEGVEYSVVGELDRGKPIIYDPLQDASLTIFHIVDDKGRNQKVFLHKSKPQDFERSEKVVLKGKMIDNEFHAKEVLLKCPSKYNEENKIGNG